MSVPCSDTYIPFCHILSRVVGFQMNVARPSHGGLQRAVSRAAKRWRSAGQTCSGSWQGPLTKRQTLVPLRCGRGPLSDRRYPGRDPGLASAPGVNGDPVLGDDVAQEADGGAAERACGRLGPAWSLWCRSASSTIRTCTRCSSRVTGPSSFRAGAGKPRRQATVMVQLGDFGQGHRAGAPSTGRT
jgi:hypothetical protein